VRFVATPRSNNVAVAGNGGGHTYDNKTMAMNTKAQFATNDQDIRLSLFLGLANWSIFVDHIPDNVVNQITARNFGFSGASDLLIFIAGYNAAVVYSRIMIERGATIGATRVLKRFWQLYAAFIVLFTTYVVSIGYVASQYSAPDLFNEFNVAALIDSPIRFLGHALLLQTKALNLDVLQLYTFLMLFFAPVLWLLLRVPGLVMAASLALYVGARQFGWNMASFPDGLWYFNPFCWQLLFVFGAYAALRRAIPPNRLTQSPILFYLASGYLVFALVMTMAGRFPAFGDMFPGWLVDTFNPNDKENLAPYRVLHLAAAVFVVTRFVSKDSPALRWGGFDPLVKCGEQSLAVFCSAVFLSFIGHFSLMISSGSVLAQILVSITGIAILTVIAYYVSWSKQQDAWKTLAAA
jgi:hypothetical protein